MALKKNNKIDLKRREQLKRLSALGVGGIFGLLLSKIALGQEFGHDASEILSGTLNRARIPLPTYDSASDSSARNTTATSYVDYPTNASPTLTVTLSLNVQSLVIAMAVIPGVTMNKPRESNFIIDIDGTEVAFGNMKHVSGTYVNDNSQWNTITLTGFKLCSSGSRTAKVRWRAAGAYSVRANEGADTAWIYVFAIPG